MAKTRITRQSDNLYTVFSLFFSYLKLLRGIVGLDGFGDDGAGGVTLLVILALRGDGPRYVATRQTQADCSDNQ